MFQGPNLQCGHSPPRCPGPQVETRCGLIASQGTYNAVHCPCRRLSSCYSVVAVPQSCRACMTDFCLCDVCPCQHAKRPRPVKPIPQRTLCSPSRTNDRHKRQLQARRRIICVCVGGAPPLRSRCQRMQMLPCIINLIQIVLQ